MKKQNLLIFPLAVFILPLMTARSIVNCNVASLDSLKVIEKVYLHIDRDIYYPGDDIWFKAYMIDASNRLLSDNSSNLHVELISPENGIVSQRVVKLSGGLGNGDIALSENLKSGRYIVRAYTNYMRNFGKDLFFNKDILIINSSDALKALTDTVPSIIRMPELTFFPEGGSLVDSVPSIVAFKAVDSKGIGCYVSGDIFSSNGDLITSFKSTHLGMGEFSLFPLPGLRYYAVIENAEGDLIRYELPESFSKGIALNLSGNQPGSLLLTFKTNHQTLPVITDKDLFLSVSARNVPLRTFSFKMKSLTGFLRIPREDLPEGVVMFSLSGPGNLPLCERLAFNEGYDDVSITVETGKPEYSQRDSVSVRISLSGSSSTESQAFLSLSATDDMFTDNYSNFPSSIASWFLLESDIRGPVEEASYYFDKSNRDRLIKLDLLLRIQGWRDFKWKYENTEYPAENGFSVSGRIRKRFADAPVKNSTVNIGFFDGNKPLVCFLPADSIGRFRLEGINLSGSARIVASITDDNDKLKGWLLLDSLRYPSAAAEPGRPPRWILSGNQEQKNDSTVVIKLLEDNYQPFIEYAETRVSMQKKYKLSDTIMLGEVKVTAKKKDAEDSPRARSRRYLMGTPDKELEITHELEAYPNTYMLIKFRFCSQYHVKGIAGLVQGEDLDPNMHNPMYLIDGSVASVADVRALPLKWVKRIDVMDNPNTWAIWANRMRMSEGDTAAGRIDGVVSIILKDDSEIEWIKPSYTSSVNFTGYSEPRLFYSPKHHKTLEADYKPDLRTTLFWEPDIKLTKEKDVILNYYNADNPATIKIVVEGLTDNGIPVAGKTSYIVH